MTMAMSSFLKLVLGVTMRELLPSLDQDPPEPRQHHRGRIDVEEGHCCRMSGSGAISCKGAPDRNGVFLRWQRRGTRGRGRERQLSCLRKTIDVPNGGVLRVVVGPRSQ